MPTRNVRPALPRHLVTAVLVVHDGEPWLDRCLAALRAQSRLPQRVVAVDTGSRDGSTALLERALGPSRVVTVDRRTGFGAAVQRGLDAYAGTPQPPNGPRDADGQPVEWVWLLHDDCAPTPQALNALLTCADATPSAAVIGPKVRDWDEPRLLLEVGLTTDGAGHRHTGLERHEVDQGQHDHISDVLAVGSAGALVRRDVWDALGGYDGRLAMFRDDLDFGWRANLAGHRVVLASEAVVHHAQAAATGRRRLAATGDHPRRVDRRNAMFTVLANASTPGFLLGVPRLALASLLRALAFLLTRRPRLVVDEVAAYLSLLARTPTLVLSRHERAAARTVPRRAVRPMLARRGARVRAVGQHIGDWALAGRGGRALVAPPVESGPTSDDSDALATAPAGLRRLLHPGVLLVLVLTAVALVAERRLLGGPGALLGGRLLAAPAGAADLWHTYLSGWHPVQVGSTVPAPPYLAVVAALSSVLFGKVWLAVDILLLGSVPLAALSAYAAGRRLVASTTVRVWAAAAYALLPVGVETVAGGRLGVAVTFAVLPLLVRAGGRSVRAAVVGGGWRHAWSAGLLLALGTAFAPDLFVVAALLLVLAVVATAVAAVVPTPAGTARRLAVPRLVVSALATLTVPAALLLPWTPWLWSHPGRLLLGVGRVVPELDLPHPRPSDLLLAWPGGVGLTVWWLTGGLVLAGLAVLLRRDRHAGAAAAWGLVAAGLAAGIVETRATATAPGVGRVLGWPGVPAAVVGAGLVLGAALAADGARDRLASTSFGWRQPLAVAVAAVAAVAPVAVGGVWAVHGVHGPVGRHDADILPAFVAESVGGPSGVRALLLRREPDGTLGYALLDGRGATLGDAELSPHPGQVRRLDTVVRTLAGGGTDAGTALGEYAVGYVVAVDPEARVSQALDGESTLSRLSATGHLQVWRVTDAVNRLALLSPLATGATGGSGPTAGPGVVSAGERPVPLPSRRDGASVDVPAGGQRRIAVFAVAADPHWRATLDGTPLVRRTAWGWAQGFELPAAGGHLVVSFDSGGRRAALLIQLGLLVLVLVLAAPTVRSADGPSPRAYRADDLGEPASAPKPRHPADAPQQQTERQPEHPTRARSSS